MPNLDPWIKQNNNNDYEDITTKTIRTNKFENHLLSIKTERQEMIHPKSHSTYNERQQNSIDMIDRTLEKYKKTKTTTTTAANTQEMNKQLMIIDNIIEELDKKRKIAINKKQKAILKDEVSIYRLEENTMDYVLFIICESTAGKLN
jgi:hypothetical protein